MAAVFTMSGFHPVRVGPMLCSNTPKRQPYSTSQGSYGTEMDGILYSKMELYLCLGRTLLCSPSEIETAIRSRSPGVLEQAVTLPGSPPQMVGGYSSFTIRVTVSPKPKIT